jgi:hypothetical protein
MSSANFSFSILLKKEEHHLMQQNNKYVSIDIPFDPNNPNSLKITHGYHKLCFTKSEEVLAFISTLDDVVKTVAIPRGPHQFRVIPVMQKNGPKKI